MVYRIGLRDTEWPVQHHISEFGSDPDDITLFGAGSCCGCRLNARVAWPTQRLSDRARLERRQGFLVLCLRSRRSLERSTPSCDRVDVDNVPLPASSLASESDSFYDGPFDVSDDEDDSSGSTFRIDNDE